MFIVSLSLQRIKLQSHGHSRQSPPASVAGRILFSEVSGYFSFPVFHSSMKHKHWRSVGLIFFIIIIVFKSKNPTVWSFPSWPLPQSVLQTPLYPSASFTFSMSVPNTSAWCRRDIKCKIKLGNQVLSPRLEALWKWLIDFHHMEELPSLLQNAQ